MKWLGMNWGIPTNVARAAGAKIALKAAPNTFSHSLGMLIEQLGKQIAFRGSTRWIPVVGWALTIWDVGTAIYVANVPHYDEAALARLKMQRDQAIASQCRLDAEKIASPLKGIPSLAPGVLPYNNAGMEIPLPKPGDWEQWPDWVRQDFMKNGMGANNPPIYQRANNLMQSIRKTYAQ
jgi:hypothetical protein